MLQLTKGLPQHCEYCGSELEWDSVNLVCTNPNCSQKNEEDLKAWIMNLASVDGIGWKTIKKVMDMVFYSNHEISIKTVTNGELPLIPGVTIGHGEQGGWNAVLTTLQTGSFSISQFLLALNIPGLGKKGAKAFEEYPNCIEYLDAIAEKKSLDAKQHKTLAKIFQDKNIADLLCNEYYNHYKFCYDLVRRRLIYTVTLDEKPAAMVGEVVITGKLSVKRDNFEQMLNSKGFKLAHLVTKNTKYLITNDPDSGTSKNRRADELGVKKVTEAEFRAMYSF